MFIGKTFSWEVVNKDLAYKTVDKSIYIHYGTGIPMDLTEFFNNDLERGEKKTIKIKFNGQIYYASLMADQLTNPRTRLIWRDDLGEKINKELKTSSKNVKQNTLDHNLRLAFQRLGLDYYEVSIISEDKEKKDLTKDLKKDKKVVRKYNMVEKRQIYEYIEVAKFYDNDMVQCKVLNKFINDADYLNDYKNKIELNSLRSLYIKDREDFFKLIEELKIRGFNFISSKESNRFFYIDNDLEDLSESKFIYLEKNKGNYKLINKSIFNNFRYEDISSDFYFNLIPIKRLRVLYPNYSENFIESTFLNYGFKLYSYKKLEKIIIRDIKTDDKESIYDFLSKEDEILKELSVDEILEYRYANHLKIKEYLVQNNIDNLLDFKNMDIEILKKLDGVGTKTIFDLKIVLNDIEKDVKENTDIYIKKIKNDYKENKDDEVLIMMLEKIKVSNLVPNKYIAYENIGDKLKKDNIYNLNQLLNYDMDKLRKLSGVGVKRIDEFQEIINQKVDEVKKTRENLEDGKFYISAGDKNIGDITICDLVFMLDIDLDYEIIEYREMKLEKFIGKKFKEIGQEYNIELAISLNFLDEMVDKLKDINIIIDRAILDLKESDSRGLEILTYRNIDNLTLEEVGQKLDLTRERIRQIESKCIKNFNEVLKNNSFYSSLNLIYLKDNKYMDHCELEKDVESLLFLNLLKTNKIKNIYYLEEVNRFYLEDKSINMKSINSKLKRLNKYGNRSELKEIIELIELEFGQFDEYKLREVFNIMGYTLREFYYFKSDISKMEQLEMLFYFIYKDGYRIDENTYKDINNDMYNLFGKKPGKTSGARSLAGMADRSDKLLLVGPRTYIHKNYAPLDKNILDSIYLILKKELDKFSLVTAERLYELYKEKNCEKNSNDRILTSHHIYSIVQEHFSDEFDFGQGNTMRILKKGQERRTNDQIIYDICKEHNGIINISDLINILNWEGYRIDSAINNNTKLLSINGKCIIVSDFFDDYVIEKIKSTAEKNLEKGYTSSKIIIEDIMFDRKVVEVLNKLNLTDPRDITCLIKYLCPDTEGHTLFLYRKDGNIKSIEDLVEYKYPKEFYREEVDYLLNKYGYAEGSLNLKLDDLREKGYIQIEETRYININKINLLSMIDSKTMDKFLGFVKESTEVDGFFIPNMHISKIKLSEGRIEYTWNQYLITALLEEKGFIRLKRFNVNYLNEIIVMVDKNSEYRSIHELVYYLLKHEYNGKMQEKHVYEYLSHLGIYQKTKSDSDKKLIGDIKYKDLIDVNLAGHVTLK